MPKSLLQTLQARAALLQQVRAFFVQQNVLEVETPLLGHAIGTDLNLSPIEASYQSDTNAEAQRMFLQTSPEFAMKRLLAEGSGSIFQICKAFRNGEAGSKHNPEFTMLEWYRVGLDEHQLMDEVGELILRILGIKEIQRLSYRELFQHYLGLDPHQATVAELEDKARNTMDIAFSSDDKDTWLDLLYSHVIEPQLKIATFIYDYPKTQAALAQLAQDDKGVEVARRFELVIQGIELANGYFELRDAEEQRRRFEADQASRKQNGLVQNPLDARFLDALTTGMPECAGVALGLDRLLMLQMQVKNIGDVLPFTIDKA